MRFSTEFPFVVITVCGTLQGCAVQHRGNYRFTGEQTLHSIGYLDFHGAKDCPLDDFGAPGVAFNSAPASKLDARHYRYFKSARLADPGTQTISIRINRCFVKYLADTDPSKEVLAFVEVTDHSDNSTRRRVFFDDQFIAEGQYLNFSGATVFGPRPYNGCGLTLRFSVVELDQDENKVAIETIRQLKETVSLAGPQVAPVTNVIASIAEQIIRANVDDRELHLVVDMHPLAVERPQRVDGAIAGNLLRVGNYVVVKREFDARTGSVASKIPFHDEITWPRWTMDNQANESDFPNVVYLGGQLYATKEYQRKTLEAEGRPALNPWQSDATFFGQLAKPETAKALAPGADLIERYPRLKNLLQEHEGLGDPYGEPDNDRQYRECPAQLVLHSYDPYTSKSYLSFTIRDDEPPVSEDVLGALETLANERVSSVVLKLTVDEQLELIRNVGAAIRSSAVALIARSELRKAKTATEVDNAATKLKERFGTEFEADLKAEVNLRKRRIEELENAVPGLNLGELGKSEVRQRLETALPLLRQRNPALAVLAERLLHGLPEPSAPVPEGSEPQPEEDGGS